MFNNKRDILKVSVVMITSLGLVVLLSNQIFFANSPRVRTDLMSRLKSGVVKLANIPANFLASISPKKPPANPTIDEQTIQKNQLAKTLFHSVSKGVYAKGQGLFTKKVYQNNQVQWATYEFDYKGKHYSIRYAAADGQPNIALFKTLLDKQ